MKASRNNGKQNQTLELSGRKYQISIFNIHKEMKEKLENTRNKLERTIKQIWKEQESPPNNENVD